MAVKKHSGDKVGLRGKSEKQILEDQLYFEKFIKGLSEREAIYLREQLCTNPEFVLVNEKSNVHQVLIESLAKSPLYRKGFDRFLAATEADLVKESEFNWLRGSLRKQIFVYYFMRNTIDVKSNFGMYGDDFLSKIMSFIDYSKVSKNIDPDKRNGDLMNVMISEVLNNNEHNDGYVEPLHFEDKIKLINQIKKINAQIIASEKYTKWIDNSSGREKGIHIVEWSYDYLRDKQKSLNGVYSPTSIEEKKEVVLAALDLFDFKRVVFDPLSHQKDAKSRSYSYIESADKILFIERMKKSWSQQKFRDAGKTKKPYHLPLTKIANARLDKMASVQGTTSTAILDMLINVAYEQDYIDEHGKDKY